jgi:hypothetical protein
MRGGGISERKALRRMVATVVVRHIAGHLGENSRDVPNVCS